MPYIDKATRKSIADDQQYYGIHTPHTAGELNYYLTMQCEEYRETHTTSYQVLNEIIGVLECVKQEYYRRIVAAYEDTKLAENGDVYDPVSPNSR